MIRQYAAKETAVINTLKPIALALLLVLGGFAAKAEAPSPPVSWEPITPIVGCDVDTEEHAGYCRLFLDTAEGSYYLVFWATRPQQGADPTWIRTGTHGEYTYIYQADVVPVGIAL